GPSRCHGTISTERTMITFRATAGTKASGSPPCGGSGKMTSASHIAPRNGAARRSRPLSSKGWNVVSSPPMVAASLRSGVGSDGAEPESPEQVLAGVVPPRLAFGGQLLGRRGGLLPLAAEDRCDVGGPDLARRAEDRRGQMRAGVVGIRERSEPVAVAPR